MKICSGCTCLRNTNLSEAGRNPIGGYFELELPAERQFPYPEAARFQSARAAFRALIRAGRPKKVWMPKFICNAMLAPLEAENIEFDWYDVNDQLEVEEIAEIGIDDWLLYVNYFGICNGHVADLIQRFSPRQLVLDYSQSFFAPPEIDALATIYSPRKFFGVPDGGLLISRIPIPPSKTRDTSSFGRISHLLRRLGDSPESGYAEYQIAENSLAECEPKRISKLSERILLSIDFNNASIKRTQNFLFLHNKLAGFNQLTIDPSSIQAPMCYPFLTRDRDLRRHLIDNRIFVPSYWPDAVDRLSVDRAEEMVRNLLPLPVDQRYGEKEMERIVSAIHGQKI